MSNDPIKKAENGTYYFRIHMGIDSCGKRKQKYCSGFKTKKEARDEYCKLNISKDEFPEKEQEPEKESLRFGEYIDQIFLPWYKSQVKEQTYDSRRSTINKNFKFFSKMPITSIEPIHVQQWQLKLSKTQSPSYVRLVQGIFSIAMDRAVVLHLAKSNPSKIIGNVKKQKVKIDFWTKEEFEKIISLIDTDDYYQFFLYVALWLLFMTGMRVGEATALQWKDIDLETGVVSITKTLLYKSQKEYKFSDPKTKASARQIVLDPDTISLMKEWQIKQEKVLRNTKFVLSYNGAPTQKHTLAHAITRYAKAAEVHRIRIHDLRHSHASLLIRLGENPLIIRDRLGHEDIETTLGTYGHLYPNTNFEVASKLKGVLNIKANEDKLSSPTKNQFTAAFKQNVQ